MKRIIYTLILLIVFLSLTTLYSAAEGVRYEIVMENEKYCLMKNGIRTAESQSLDSLCDGLSALGEEIYFRDIIFDGELSLEKGEYIIAGSLSVKQISVEPGTTVRIDGAEVNTEEPIRNNGGRLYVSDCGINSQGSAIVQTYSAEAYTEISDTEILSSSDIAAIIIEEGSFRIEDSQVKCDTGYAVQNDGSLYLGGASTLNGAVADIYTSRAIWGYSGDKQFLGSITIKYSATFEKGSSTNILYTSDATEERYITVIDKNGREYPATNIGGALAVYLPYRVDFYLDERVFLSNERLLGDRVSMPEISAPDGYKITGWYTDSKCTEQYDFATRVEGDLSLYCGLELTPPTYSINGIEKIYDSEACYLGFTSLSHILDGVYLYEWYNERGELISTAECLSLTEVKDSGRYKCKLTFTFNGDTVVLETPEVKVEIKKAVVNIPIISAVEYTGNLLYPNIVPVGFDYESEGFRDAGDYKIPLRLLDSDNYIWEDGSESVSYADFSIKRAENKWIVSPDISDIYSGCDMKFSAVSKFGAPTPLFYDPISDSYTNAAPTFVGDYLVVFSVKETSNYSGLISEPLKFSILVDKLVSFTVNSYPEKSVYYSFDSFDPRGVSFSCLYSSGKVVIVGSESVSFIYQTDDSLRTSHSSVIASYEGQHCLLPITVLPREYDYDIRITDTEISYSGGYNTILAVGGISEGLDGSRVSYSITGGGTDVGEYIVELVFFTDSSEYTAPTKQTAILTVLPLELKLLWSDTEFVYDGSPKVPKAEFTDVFGIKRQLSVEGTASAAADGYIAVAPERYLNYAFVNPTVRFTIKKADYDLSGVFWSGGNYVYSGERQGVYLHGLPDGVSVIGYTNNTAVNAGEYLASAVLSYDTKNYNPPCIDEYIWRVNPAEYDISELVVSGGEYIFNGEARFPSVSGELPVGYDGSILRLSFSHGVVNVTDKDEVVVSFISDSENYTAPAPITVVINILPVEIYAEWSFGVTVYNGAPQSPKATAKECALEVSGGFTDAGVYTVGAVTLDPNYKLLNATYRFVILKADNCWTKEPEAADIFEGMAPEALAEAAFGAVEFLYYEDAELTRLIEKPILPGRYYAVAVADAGKNYNTLVSSPVPFSVIAITPISLRVEGRGEYTAYEKASDLSVTLINNDGSERALSLDELELVYSRGDSFRYGDTALTVRYKDVTSVYSVTVEKATYDLSGVSWLGLTQEYSGKPKYPELIGLPEGVAVLEYIGAGGYSVGEYEVGVRLSFDEKNYNPPIIPSAVMEIKPKGIVPECIELIFTGKPQMPMSENPVCIPETISFVDAGIYTVRFALSDNDNYYLITDTAQMIIHPMPVMISISDTDAYWFGEYGEFSAVVLDSGISLEELMLEYTVEDGKITATAKNKNYELITDTGDLIKHNRFSPRMTRVLFVCLLLFLLVVFGVIIIVLRRDELIDFCSRIYSRATVRENYVETIPIGDYMSVDADRADTLISDSIARTLIHTEDTCVVTRGNKRYSINIDKLSECFAPGERVDVNILKERGIIPKEVGYLKILGRGSLDKPLRVYANAFSMSAVKMIVLTGGEAIKVKK